MDFPRGKLPPGSHLNRRKRKSPADVLFKKDVHFDGEKKKAKRRKKKKSEEGEMEDKVVIESVSMKRLPVGTTILGCVSKVTDYEITMTIPGGGSVSVPIFNISDSYSDLVERFVADPTSVTPFKPQSMFEIGQCLPVKILEKEGEGRGKKGVKVVGSLNPRDVYKEVHPVSLESCASSVVISAAVTGIEDHGYIMDIGQGEEMSGFLSGAEAKEYLKRRQLSRIPVGSLLFCAGVSASSRVVRVTSKRERVESNIVTGDSEILPLTSLVPGLQVSVRVMDVSERGLEIMVVNEHKGYIHKDHLKSEWDLPDKNYSISSLLHARILFVHPLSHLVVCSLRDLPDPDSIGTKFGPFSPGNLVTDATVAHFDERGNMVLVSKRERVKLLATRSSISDSAIDDVRMMEEYPVGSRQKCRVLGLNHLDHLVRVTLRPSYLSEEFISIHDISVGAVLTGRVKNVTRDGVYLKLGPRLTAFARSLHLADTPSLLHPEKVFPLDKSVKCRILQVDSTLHPPKITVTCKKSLLSNHLNILHSIHLASPGFHTLGVVVLANKSGLLLEFFAGLQGWISRILLTDYDDIPSAFLKGQIVKCYVISSDPKTGRISLSLNDRSKSVESEEPTISDRSKRVESEEPTINDRSKRVESEEPVVGKESALPTSFDKKDNPLAAGKIVTGRVTRIEDGGLVLELSSKVTSTVPLTHVTDSQYINKRELERRFKVGDEVKCRIISWSQGSLSVTMKPSLLNPAIEVWKSVPRLQTGMTSIGVPRLQTGMTSIGFISKILVKKGRIVTFIGGSKGFLKESLIQENKCGYRSGRLQPGELVACQIIHVDPVTKRLSLDLFSMDSFMTQIAPQTPVTTGFSFTTPDAPQTPVTTGFSFTTPDELTGETLLQSGREEGDVLEGIQKNRTRTIREGETVREKRSQREKETELRRKETRLAKKELRPETEEEHERRVVSDPNSCIGWLEYMSYLLECNEIEKARSVGERGLKRMSVREEEGRFNMWIALINLEHFYGDQESLSRTVERAREVNDPMKVDLRVGRMYQEGGESELAEQVYESMGKKYKQEKSYWIEYGMMKMKEKQFQSARCVMKKALDSLPPRHHLDLISKFAQMEFRSGQIEHAKSLFDNILTNYPRRTDVWIVYLSMLIKYSINPDIPSSDQLDSIRCLFQRILSLGLSAKKVAPIFKKFLDFEQTYGNASTVQSVKDKSVMYVGSNKLQSFME